MAAACYLDLFGRRPLGEEIHGGDRIVVARRVGAGGNLVGAVSAESPAEGVDGGVAGRTEEGLRWLTRRAEACAQGGPTSGADAEKTEMSLWCARWKRLLKKVNFPVTQRAR